MRVAEVKPVEVACDCFSESLMDNLSCVANAEPRNMLCGITVAPIIPIAADERVNTDFPQ